MKNIFYFLLAFTILVGASSCSKDAGPEGPAGTRGDRGEKGDKGETGAKGIAGTDGNLLLYGNAAPAATLGQLGDFYVDKANSKLYGPKAVSGWGAAVGMRGATGATGATGVAGSQFISGTIAPAATAGKPGDFYFNSATGQLFGPKNSNNTWAGGISLKGPKGAKGDTGAKGETGAQGVRGTDGNLILSGAGVPASTLGKVGDYYIDKTNLKLYGPKVAEGWGVASDMRGAIGGTGATGTAGSQIFSGTVAPAAGTGKPGDFYFHTTTGKLFGPKNTNNTWGGGVSLKGEKGEKGDKGDPGQDGNANVKKYSFSFERARWSPGSDVHPQVNYFHSASPYYEIGAVWLDDPDYVAIIYVKPFRTDGNGGMHQAPRKPLPYFHKLNSVYGLKIELANRSIRMYKTSNGWDSAWLASEEMPDRVDFDIILIRVGLANALAGKLNFNDYKAVTKHFDLKD